MDHLEHIAASQERTSRFARRLGAGTVDPPVLEQWLKFWDDSESDFGNLDNLEHWLKHSEAARTAPR